MANAFNHGDVVVLKSGGPPMTIDKIPGDKIGEYTTLKNYKCLWFKGATAESGAYDEHVLIKFVPPTKAPAPTKAKP